MEGVEALQEMPDCAHAYHLFVGKLRPENLKTDRDKMFQAMRASGVGVNVHYLPVHLHPYYRRRFGTGEGLCPGAEAAFERIISLPMYRAFRCQSGKGGGGAGRRPERLKRNEETDPGGIRPSR
jgi:perosamine synthetase